MGTDILPKIYKFLEQKPEFTKSSFGLQAMGDPNFVFDIEKKNRRLWPETVEKVTTFIKNKQDTAK